MFYAINLRKFYKTFIRILIFTVLIFLLFKLALYAIPLKYVDIIEKYSKEYSVDKSLICAIIVTESHFDENAVSIKGASGLMQLMESTATWIAEKYSIYDFTFEEDIFNPDLNIRLGTLYLSQLLEQYENDEELALAGYNAGTGNVSKWLRDTEYSEDGETLTEIPFKETKNYVKKVMFYKEIYTYIFKVRDFFVDN